MVSIEADGTIVFSIRQPEARTVELVGAFDGWHERRLSMRRRNDGPWHLAIDPGPGAYLFRYLVDSTQWIVDEDAHGSCIVADGSVKSRVWRPPLRLDPDSLAA